MRYPILAATPACLLASFISFATAAPQADTPARFDGHVVVRAEVESIRALQTMLAISPDCWSESIGVGTLDFRIPPDRMEALKTSGIDFEVIIDDVQELIDAESAWHDTHQWNPDDVEGGVAGGSDFFDDYRTVAEFTTYLAGLVDEYPTLISRTAAGTSIEGRTIWAYVITSPTDNDKRGICINGGAHAREWVSPMTCAWLITKLLEGHGTDEEVTGLLDETEWHVLPIMNPDGYQYTWDENRLWRKTRLDNGDGTFGVDWNRNFAAGWGGDGASDNTNSDIYHGVAPFSEPESQALRDWILGNTQIVAHVDVHSYSQLMLYSYGYEFGIPDGADGTCLSDLARAMVDEIYSSDQKVYTPQPAYDLYIASGTSLDWSYDYANCLSFTVELRDTGQFGFVLPANQIVPTATENFLSFLKLGEAVRSKLYVALPSGWPGELEAGSPTPVSVDIAPTWDRSGAISAASLRYQVDAGAWQTAPMTDVGNGRFDGTLPAFPCGAVVQSTIQASGPSGDTYIWPNDGSTLDSIAFESTVFFIDDFEADLGWTVVNDSGLTDGEWDRNLTLGGGDRGDPGEDYDGSGRCYLTDSADGNTDVDGGGTELTSPLLDGSNAGSELVYARWYSNNFGGDPFNDVMTVSISGNGGTSWTILEIVGPEGQEAAGGWYLQRWALSELPTVGLSDQIRIRFRAEDIGDGSIVEAAVDNVRIEVTECAGTPGDVDGDGDVDGADLSALLGSWGPCRGCDADLNFDGVIDGVDLSILLGNWG